MKKIEICLLLLFFMLAWQKQYAQLEPHEWLEIAFEDATGAKDTVVVGFYNDPNFFTSERIVSLGVNPEFGEVNLPDIPENSFTVLSEIKAGSATMLDYLEEDVYLKKDIRYNDGYCIDHGAFDLYFYNAEYPIIAEISLNRGLYENLPYEVGTSGCFCDIIFYEGELAGGLNYWERYVLGCWGSGWYDKNSNGSLIDIIDCQSFDKPYTISIYEIITGIKTVESKNDLTIFPNPVINLLTAKLKNVDNHSKNFIVEIYNVSGSLIYTDEFIETINVSGFQSGFYKYILRDDQNRIIKSLNFIKL